MRRLLLIGGIALGGWVVWRRALSAPVVNLKDKVVVITGASSGIGWAAARAFAAQGAKLVLVARREALLNDLKAELEATYGATALVVPADISREADREAVVAATLREFGALDVLVNNAGIGHAGGLETMKPAAIREIIDLNFRAAVLLTRAALPAMLAQGSGHIVNVSSIGGVAQMPGQNVYAATKAGLIGFSDALRREVSGRGVRVSTILPGFTATSMLGETPEQVSNFLVDNGLNLPGVSLDDPAVVGGAIVNAVRFNRREWITGGPAIVLAVNLARVFPGLLDLALKLAKLSTYGEDTPPADPPPGAAADGEGEGL
jgi:short-subunit dehydrogenase